MVSKDYVEYLEAVVSDTEEPNVLYRIDSAGPSYYIELWEISRYTKKGVYVVPYGWSIYENPAIIKTQEKWINLDWRKKFAHPTLNEAIDAFRKRKLACIRHCKRNMENAQAHLNHIPAIRLRAFKEQAARIEKKANELEQRLCDSLPVSSGHEGREPG